MINRRPPAAPAPDTNRHLALFAVVAVVALLAGCSASASESRTGGGPSGVLMPAAGESTRASRAVPDQVPAQRGGARETPGFVDGSAPRSTDSVTPYLPPASARQQSMIGAEAFVRFFWASVESSLANPEFGAIEPYYLASCSQCARLDDRIGDLAEALAPPDPAYDRMGTGSAATEITKTTGTTEPPETTDAPGESS